MRNGTTGVIRTVLGDLALEKLGWCQCHEHVFLADGPSRACNPALWMEDEDATTRELKDYAAAGGHAIVDAQPVFCGRMAEALARAAKASGVSVVASTGFHKQCFYDADSPVFHWTEEMLQALFAAEIAEGMRGADGRGLPYRAGIVKIAVDEGGVCATKNYEKLHHAAVGAAAQTGAAMMAHFEKNGDVFELLRLMEAYGIPATRLIACHLDRMRPDPGYLCEVAAAGAYLDFDSVNRLKYLSHEAELALITAVLDAGHAARLMLSLDTTNRRLRSYGGDMGLDYIRTTFRPMLNGAGVTDETIRQMMCVNPAEAIKIATKE